MTATTRTELRSIGEPRLYVAFELGKKEWKLAMTSGFGVDPWLRTVPGGDVRAVERAIDYLCRTQLKGHRDAETLRTLETGVAAPGSMHADAEAYWGRTFGGGEGAERIPPPTPGPIRVSHPLPEPAGSWQETWFTGTGFPKVFYLRYHLYRHYLPVMALARYLRLKAQQQK